MAAEQEEGSGGKKASAALQQAGQFGKDHWKAIGVIIAGITLVFVYLQYRNSLAPAAAPGVTGADPATVVDTTLGDNPTTSNTGGGSGTGTTSTGSGSSGSGSGGSSNPSKQTSASNSINPPYRYSATAAYLGTGGGNLPTAPARTLM